MVTLCYFIHRQTRIKTSSVSLYTGNMAQMHIEGKFCLKNALFVSVQCVRRASSQTLRLECSWFPFCVVR